MGQLNSFMVIERLESILYHNTPMSPQIQHFLFNETQN